MINKKVRHAPLKVKIAENETPENTGSFINAIEKF